MTATWWLLPILLLAWLLLWWVTRTKVLGEKERSVILRKWKEVEALLTEGRKQEAVIEADKTLDWALKQMNIKGESFTQRFKRVEEMFSNREEIWAAHKTRNQLVHDIDARVGEAKMRTAINAFERALRKLGGL